MHDEKKHLSNSHTHTHTLPLYQTEWCNHGDCEGGTACTALWGFKPSHWEFDVFMMGRIPWRTSATSKWFSICVSPNHNRLKKGFKSSGCSTCYRTDAPSWCASLTHAKNLNGRFICEQIILPLTAAAICLPADTWEPMDSESTLFMVTQITLKGRHFPVHVATIRLQWLLELIICCPFLIR